MVSKLRVNEQGQVVEVELKHALLEERRVALQASEAHLSLSLTVNRASLVESLLVALSTTPARNLLRKPRVHFEGEAGIDAGGLTKEMYTLFATELVVPEKCMLFRACEAPGESPCFLPAADFDGDLTMYAPVRLGARIFRC